MIINSKKRFNKSLSGFLLIEVGITLSLLVLIATLIIVNISFFNSLLIRSEIEKMYSICMYMQRCAMVSNKKQELIFNERDKTYFYNGYKERLPFQVNFGFLSGTKGPPSIMKSTIQSAITFKDHRILFHPDGIIQPGTVYLTDTSKSFMYALSSPIAQVSYLRKYRYDDTWRCLS